MPRPNKAGVCGKMNNQPTRGGSRPGAGRPSLDGPTTTLTFRIPNDDIERLKKAGVTNISRFYVMAGRKAIRRLI
jgi:hypothetical protein